MTVFTGKDTYRGFEIEKMYGDWYATCHDGEPSLTGKTREELLEEIDQEIAERGW